MIQLLINKHENVKDYLADVDGVLVPGGFGFRASEGKISAIKYARENNVPYFGICLGLNRYQSMAHYFL